MEMSAEQSLLIGLIASVIVFVVNEVGKRSGVALQRKWLTGTLFLLALALTPIFNPMAMPSMPIFSGDVGVDAGLLAGWLAGLAGGATQAVGAATLLYNVLLKQVMERVAVVVA